MMQEYLKIVGNGRRTARDLTVEEAERAFTLIMEGRASVAQVAAFMAALRIKEESAEELATFANVLRRYCQITPYAASHLVDICVPYDGRLRQPSLIPAAALIAAAAGAKVGLHGRCGQTTSPKFGVGIGDVLAALGIAVNLPLDTASSLLLDDSIGVSYVDSSQFAPALEAFNTVRLDFGMRSFFNTVEKLINPFGASNAIVGVFHNPVMERVASAMQQQVYRRGLVVQGTEGAIDVLTSRRTPVVEFQLNAALDSWIVDPADHGGWSDVDKPEAQVTPQVNAALTQQILDPRVTAPEIETRRRGALLTAALIIYAAWRAAVFADALEQAYAALDSGEAASRLSRWQQHSACVSDQAVEMHYGR